MSETTAIGVYVFSATYVTALPAVLLVLPWWGIVCEVLLVLLVPALLVWGWSGWVRADEPVTEAGAAEEDAMSGVPPAEGVTGAAPPSDAGTPPPAPTPPTVAASAGLSADQLGTLRATLIAANPNAIPELIAGDNFEQLVASVGTATTAGAEFARRLNVQTAGIVVGGGSPPVDAAIIQSLAPEAKIAYAMRNKAS